MDIPKSLKGVPLAYEYKSVELDKTERMAGASCKIGKPVTFREDGDTLLVEQDGTLLGQMKPTRIADMIRDWERRKDPYLAELSAFPLGGGAAKLTLAFYREESAWWRDRREKIVARIGRPEPKLLVDMIGKQLAVYLDEETGRYILCAHGLDAGLLPLPAVDQIHAISREPEDMVYILDHTDEDEEISRKDWYVVII